MQPNSSFYSSHRPNVLSLHSSHRLNVPTLNLHRLNIFFLSLASLSFIGLCQPNWAMAASNLCRDFDFTGSTPYSELERNAKVLAELQMDLSSTNEAPTALTNQTTPTAASPARANADAANRLMLQFKLNTFNEKFKEFNLQYGETGKQVYAAELVKLRNHKKAQTKNQKLTDNKKEEQISSESQELVENLKKLISPRSIAKITNQGKIAHNGLQVTADSKYLVYATQTGDFKIIEIATGKTILAEKFNFQVNRVHIHADGKFVSIAGGSSEIKMYELATGTLIREFANMASNQDLTTSLDGSVMITACHNNSINFIDINSGQVLASIPDINRIDSLVRANDGQHILAVAHDAIFLVDVRSQKLVGKLDIKVTRSRVKVSENPAHANLFVFTTVEPDALIFYNLNTNKITPISLKKTKGFFGTELIPNEVQALKFSDDGNTLAVTTYDRDFYLFDGKTFDLKNKVTGIKERGTYLEFTPTNNFFAVGGIDVGLTQTNLSIIDGTSGLVLNSLLHQANVVGMQFLADGKHLVSISNDNSIRFIDASQGEIRKEISTSAYPNNLVSSPDGQFVIVETADQQVEIFQAFAHIGNNSPL